MLWWAANESRKTSTSRDIESAFLTKSKVRGALKVHFRFSDGFWCMVTQSHIWSHVRIWFFIYFIVYSLYFYSFFFISNVVFFPNSWLKKFLRFTCLQFLSWTLLLIWNQMQLNLCHFSWLYWVLEVDMLGY